ncbi:MAG: alpha/beta hydrolase [Gammaproteobacteria bacterium]|nr:alpha/beta hydrolase [Gammaproteobacteria bacterium]
MPSAIIETRVEQAVMVLPGLLATDLSTVLLRTYLVHEGYRALPWGFGQNRGPSDDLLMRLATHVRAVAEASGGRVSLIGHSLGGIYAREIAKIAAESVQLVITLGSPFRSSAARGACRSVVRLIERTTGKTIEELLGNGASGPVADPPPVPSIAFYSRSDRIAHWQACMEPVSPLTQNIEVHTSHQRMVANASVFRRIASILNAHTRATDRSSVDGDREAAVAIAA